jgi:hypothetical protein
LANARNQGIFSVTAIFLTNFLTNMPKIQKIHFFLMLIYIIIKRVYGAGGQPAGGNSARNVPGNSPSACRNGKTIPETVPLSREKQEYTARVPGGNG